jgi:deoxyribonuclease V
MAYAIHNARHVQSMKEASPMKLAVSHSWDLSVAEAKALQLQLAEKVIPTTTFDPATVQTVAGVDVSFAAEMAQAAVVVMRLPDLEPVDYALGKAPLSFPYVPGLLTFREGPSVLNALEKLTIWPDLFIFDGHGMAHPRRIGLAAHMGVVLDHASIGCAKSRLTGKHDEPGDSTGDWVPLWDEEATIGAVLRTQPGVRPLYVSIGHRVDLPTAVDFVLRCTRGHRLPETTRYAHRAASGAKLQLKHRHGIISL